MSVPEELYVSNQGSDQGSGLESEPFNTLQKAQRAVRQRIEKGLDRDIVVYLREGNYPLRETLVFTPEDSPNADHTVTYCAYPGERVIVSSGISIEGWERVAQPLPGLQDSLQGMVWAAPLPEVKGEPLRFKTLYDGSRRMTRARCKGFAPLLDISEEERKANEFGVSEDACRTLHFPQGAMKNWSNIQDAELLVRPTFGWTMNILEIESVDESKGVAVTRIPSTYAMRKLQWTEVYQYGPESCWVENVIEGLKAPGEWMLDSRKGKVYMIPEGSIPSNNITVPSLKEYIRLEGREEKGEFVQNIIFKDLVFMHAERDTWTEEDIGLQHDWEMYSKGNAVFRMKDARNCTVAGCTFTASGNTAVRLDLYCQNNKIVNNSIHHMGGTGILLCGYGPGLKDVNKYNHILNNHIHHCGEIYWMNHAIFIWQSGDNLIAHNLIHDMPYNAIGLSGVRPHFLLENKKKRELYGTIRREEIKEVVEKACDKIDGGENIDFSETSSLIFMREISDFLHTRNNVLEYNEIHDVMQVMADGDAIYLSATGKNNVLRRNYIHDVVTYGSLAHIIRNDGMQYWTLTEENIIYRCSGTIVLRPECHAINNYIIDIQYPPHTQHMRRKYAALELAPAAREWNENRRVYRNVYYQAERMDSLYIVGWTDKLEFDDLVDVEGDSNLFWCRNDAQGFEEQRKELFFKCGMDEHSLCMDPLFYDVEKGDFRVRENSPLYQLGIIPIDTRGMGLLKENKEEI